MALKDLKSDLSKFRMPKKDPLESKERVTVNKNLNKTPLSSMVESAPKIPRSQTTTNKEGVNPKNMDNTSKFLGETTPTPSNNTSKFLGETTPTPSNNSEKFLGETTPTPSNNSEKFLGETTTKPLSLEERYLGETTPTNSDNTSKFLGETTPTKFDNNENFLGLTTPTLSNRESKFLGETTPNSADNTSKFLGETTPNSADNTSKFLGETTPNSADNTSKFLGETTQTPSNNKSKFLGETTQAPSNNTSKFLGETTPRDVNYITDIHAKGFNSKFGATLPANSKFTGVSKSQLEWNNNSIYGKRKAVNFFPIETSKARGFSLNQVHRDETKFTGIKRGLNETTADDKDAFNENSSLYSKRKAVDFFPIETSKARGFSLNEFYLAPSQFTGVSKDQSKWSTISSEYSSFAKYTHVNLSTVKSFGGNPSGKKQRNNIINTYYLDSFQTGNFAVDLTKGKLPDESKWVSNLSEYSNYSSYIHPDLSSAPGYGKFKLQKQASGQKQSYNQDSTYYMDSFQRGDFALDLTKGKISKLQEMRNSPSFLDEMYSKFNLRDDAHNTGMTAFDHPLILRGIQRRGKRGTEPQNFGIPGTSIDLDDGLIRGGIITSTTRAVIDAIRLGKWMVSVKGLLWGIKQFGLQQSNPNVEKLGLIRRTKIWTPINTLASALGQHIGLHPNRHGFTPFDLNDGGYESVQSTKTAFHKLEAFPVQLTSRISIGGNRLARLWKTSFDTDVEDGLYTRFGSSVFGELTGIGGTNSVYGLIPNGKFPTKDFQSAPYRDWLKYFYRLFGKSGPKKIGGSYKRPYTINLTSPDKIDENAFSIKGIIEGKNPNTTELNGLKFPYLNADFKKAKPNAKGKFTDKEGVANKAADAKAKKFNGGGANKVDVKGNGTDIPNGYEVIKDYQTIAYGKIPTRIAGTGKDIDFRSLLTEDSNEYKRAFNKDGESIYEKQNINTRVGFGKPGFLGPNEDRIRWWNTSPESVNFLNRFDKVNAAEPGAADVNDLVHLWFRAEGGKKVQFRGTVAGITDTFSPSWDSVKYNGRADQAYNYSTFERSLSFNFKVMATSRVEMKPIWNKLSYLSTMTMPKYGTTGNDGYQGTLIYFRLGSLYNNKLAFIESLSYSISDEVSWEISPKGTENSLGEIPKMIDVSIGLKILGNSRPTVGESSGVYEADFLTKSDELKAEEQAAAVTGDTLFDGDVTPTSGFGSGNLSSGFGGFG